MDRDDQMHRQAVWTGAIRLGITTVGAIALLFALGATLPPETAQPHDRLGLGAVAQPGGIAAGSPIGAGNKTDSANAAKPNLIQRLLQPLSRRRSPSSKQQPNASDHGFRPAQIQAQIDRALQSGQTGAATGAEAPDSNADQGGFLRSQAPSPLLPNVRQATPSSTAAKTGANQWDQALPELPELKIDELADSLPLSLEEVIYLALENNLEIKNAYLDRVAEQAERQATERKFAPRLTPRLTLDRTARQLSRGSSEGNLAGALGAEVTLEMPTGGQVTLSWNSDANRTWGNGSQDSREAKQGYQLRLRQPLVRGAGAQLSQLDIERAGLTDQTQFQTLRSTLIGRVTAVVQAYRALMQAQEAVQIARLSLQTAQESLGVTQALIQAGRRAPVEIIQNQADLAALRVSFLEATETLDSQRLALLKLLNLDQPIRIAAEPMGAVTPPQLDVAQLQATALNLRPDYLQSRLAIAQSQLNLRQAEDARRWEVNLEASLSDTTAQALESRLGLSASRTLGAADLEARVVRSRIEQQKASNSFKNQQQQVSLEIQDQVRSVNAAYQQLEAARRSTALAEQRLEIAREKQRLGREELVNLIQFQNELAQRRNGELNAGIAYLNALTLLEQAAGTTLEAWGIGLKPEAAVR